MASLSNNNSRKPANFFGFYKGIPLLTIHMLPYKSEFAGNWVLLASSLIVAAPIIFTKIKEFVPLEDLKFYDATVEEVAATW